MQLTRSSVRAVHRRVASRLSEEELLVLDQYYAVARTGTMSGVLALGSLVSQAITWLARGETNVITPGRLSTRSLLPEWTSRAAAATSSRSTDGVPCGGACVCDAGTRSSRTLGSSAKTLPL